jgi:hypothetical protein
VEVLVTIVILFGLFVIVRLMSRRDETVAYRKRERERVEAVREAEAARRRREAEERSRYIASVLDGAAQRAESNISAEELSAIRDAHPDYVDQFMLVRWGWSPLVVLELDPPEIVVRCANRQVALYAKKRVAAMEEDAIDRSADHVDRLCREAEEAERKRQAQLVADEEERVRRKRLEEQIVIDIATLKQKTRY